MKTKQSFMHPLLFFSAPAVGILSIIICYLAYVYVPPAYTSYKSPYLKSIRSEFVKTDEFIIHYTHKGKGEPLILIHGCCSWAYSFRNNIPALSKKFSVYALDMPGSGYTVPICNNPDYDLTMMSDTILNFMDSKQIKQAALVGHSSGGGWALHFASLHPERTKKLVLIGSSGFAVHEKNAFKYFSFPVIGELFVKFFTFADLKKGYEESFYDTSLISDKMIQEIMVPLTFTHNRKAQYRYIRNQNWLETELALSKITIPTLVIWGKNDRYLDCSLAYRFSKAMPNTQIEVIRNCGHSAHEEKPDKINQLILDFL